MSATHYLMTVSAPVQESRGQQSHVHGSQMAHATTRHHSCAEKKMHILVWRTVQRKSLQSRQQASVLDPKMLRLAQYHQSRLLPIGL